MFFGARKEKKTLLLLLLLLLFAVSGGARDNLVDAVPVGILFSLFFSGTPVDRQVSVIFFRAPRGSNGRKYRAAPSNILMY